MNFYLDDPGLEGSSFHSEGMSPYDFQGGSAAAANPFDADALSPGSHTITADITKTDGTHGIVSADVTVA